MYSREGFEIERERPASEVILLRVRGEIDLWASLPLMEAISEAFAGAPALIAIDLSEVTYMDSAGLRPLVEGSRHLEEAHTRFVVICTPGSQVARLLGQPGAHRALNVHESREDALGPWLDEAGELPAGV